MNYIFYNKTKKARGFPIPSISPRQIFYLLMLLICMVGNNSRIWAQCTDVYLDRDYIRVQTVNYTNTSGYALYFYLTLTDGTVVQVSDDQVSDGIYYFSSAGLSVGAEYRVHALSYDTALEPTFVPSSLMNINDIAAQMPSGCFNTDFQTDYLCYNILQSIACVPVEVCIGDAVVHTVSDPDGPDNDKTTMYVLVSAGAVVATNTTGDFTADITTNGAGDYEFYAITYDPANPPSFLPGATMPTVDMMTAEANAGVCFNADMLSSYRCVTVNALPMVTIADQTICADVTTVDLSALEPAAYVGGVWTDGSAALVADATAADPSTGPFTYTYTDATTTCSDTAVVAYTITPLPDASFTMMSFCEGAASLAATITGDAGGIFSFDPAPADGATIDGITGVISGGTAGTSYSVKYAVTVNGCSDSTIVSVSATACACTPVVICDGDDLIRTVSDPNGPDDDKVTTYILTDGSNVVVTTSASGDFTSSVVGGNTYNIYALTYDAAAPPSFMPLLAGATMPTSAELATETVCYNTDFLTDYLCVTVNMLPMVTIADQTICADVTTVDLSALEPAAYVGGVWTDGSAAVVADATAADPSTGPFTYTYTDVTTTCSDTAVVSYTITPLPDASFTMMSFCEGAASLAATITGDAGGIFSFDPAPADGATIDGITGVISGGTAGTSYSVKYAVTVNGCSDSTIVSVSATACACTPVVICDGDDLIRTVSDPNGPDDDKVTTYILTDGSNVVVTTSASGDFTSSVVGGNTYNIYALTYDAAAPPSFMPLLAGATMPTSAELATETVCYNTDFLTDYLCVTVNMLPMVTIADQTICADVTTVDLSALEPAAYVGGVWTDGSAALVADATAADPSTGPFTYTYTDATTTCSDTAVVAYTITPLPDASFTMMSFCEGAASLAATVTGDAGGLFSFDLAPADGATIDGTTGIISGGTAGTSYSVKYAVTMNGCSDSTIVSVSATACACTPVVICDGDDLIRTVSDPNGPDDDKVTTYILTDGSNVVVTTNASGDFTGSVVGGNTYNIYALTYDAAAPPSFMPLLAGATMPTSAELATETVCYNTDFLTDYLCVTVNMLPMVTIADQTICADVTAVDLSALEPAAYVGGVWTDGSAALVADATAADPSTGPFTYTYTDATTTCSDTAVVAYTITPLPDASFTMMSFCEGAASLAATVTGDAGGLFSFDPAPADGATIDGITGVISGGTAGTSYSVKYAVTMNGCSDSTIVSVSATACAVHGSHLRWR
ncbi:MAG: hypothetical protein IPL35_16960 [Sphingobacteriales bacterium]|nr:hypothetical protein [Sphingobacteriales bacterium]